MTFKIVLHYFLDVVNVSLLEGSLLIESSIMCKRLANHVRVPLLTSHLNITESTYITNKRASYNK
jgi:hypothetical protein